MFPDHFTNVKKNVKVIEKEKADDPMPSPRNKTLHIRPEDAPELVPLCAVPEGPLNAGTVENRVFCGDFFDLAPRMEEGLFDLVIADPPYNLTKDFGGESFRKTDPDSYEAFTERWVTAVKRLMKPGATLYVCCDWESSLTVGNVLLRHFDVRSRITWQREKGRGAKRNWKNSMEDIWFCTLGDGYQFHLDAVKLRKKVVAPYRENGEAKDWQETEDGRYRLTCPSNFWDDITVPFWSMAENTAHPTQKPEKLIARLLLASSSEGDLVFDPFGGSGTTAAVAEKLGRRYTVVEKNLQYCVWALERLRRAETDKTVQGMKDGVFLPRNEY